MSTSKFICPVCFSEMDQYRDTRLFECSTSSFFHTQVKVEKITNKFSYYRLIFNDKTIIGDLSCNTTTIISNSDYYLISGKLFNKLKMDFYPLSFEDFLDANNIFNKLMKLKVFL